MDNHNFSSNSQSSFGSSGQPPITAPNSPDPSDNAKHSGHDVPVVGGDGTFTGKQLTELAKWAVEDGYLSLEEANKSLVAAGNPPLDDPNKQNPYAAEMDRAFPPAKPDDYDLPPLVDTHEKMTPEAFQAGKTIRNWLSEARFTREQGSFLAHEISRVGHKVQKMSDLERNIWSHEQRSLLSQLWGSKTNERIALAQQLVQESEAKHPGLGLVDILESSGAGNSAMVIAQIYAQAQVLYDRQGPDTKKKR